MDDLKHLQGLIDRDWLKRITDPMAEIRQQMQAAYVDPFREVRERMLDPLGMQAVAEKFKAATAMPSVVQDFLDQQRKQQEGYAKFFDMRPEWDRMIHDITNPIRGLGIDTKTYLDAIGLGPGSELVSMLEEFREQFDKLPGQVRMQVALLIERGWCLDPEMTQVGLQEMVFAIEGGEEADVQAELVDYFRSRLDDIETTLKERHPQRLAVLDDAFKAHREGRYVLSIPVFLAQADGITFERVERQLYSRKRSKGVTGYVDSLPEDDLMTVYWSGFTIDADAPLTRDTRQLPAGFDGLNRHAVLHGTDPNYGTEVNSLRAVSILNLASYLLTASAHDEDSEHAVA